MKRTMFGLTVLGLAISGTLVVAPLLAQAPPGARSQQRTQNPFDGDAAALRVGTQIFRGRCAGCHGLGGRGYIGPDLAQTEKTDAELFQVIQRGIPGTEMPGYPADAPEDYDFETWQLVTFVRSLATTAKAAPIELKGDAANGSRLFWGSAGCGTCHSIAGQGGRLGPELTRGFPAGARDVMIREIRRPNEVIRTGYATVTIVNRDGTRIRGILKNEDTFSLRMMDAGGRLLGIDRAEVREVIAEPGSLMPAYGPDRLSDAAVDDLVRYLASLHDSAGQR